MQWTPGGESQDIEDRRDQGGGGDSFGGGGGMSLGGRHIGIGGLIVLGLLSLVFKRDFLSPFIAGGGGGAGEPSSAYSTGMPASAPNPAQTQAEQPMVQFVSFVFDDVQKTWTGILPPLGFQYRHAKLVLFRNETSSGCGAAEEASGPFYCPEDEKVYIDLAFYQELKDRFGAPGQFAQAYVLAHELGHHVQKIMGIEAKVRQLQEQNQANVNPLSVRLELQADCFAGIWGHSTQERKILDPGDIDSGLQAAAAVGDDHIAHMEGQRVSPESFTHGSSAQRTMWFKRGFDSGEVKDCDTFAAQ